MKSNSTEYSPDRTDTKIGAGMCIDGNVSFTGVLRVQGNLLGDVSCDSDPKGAMVADSSGTVTGTVTAPNVVVKGRVHGTVHSSQTIRIQQDACVVGDVYYKEMEIHKGGVIEGLLIPDCLAQPFQRQEQRIQSLVPPAGNESALPLADGLRLRGRLGAWSILGVVGMLVIVVFAVVRTSQDSTAVKLPAENFALRTDSSLKQAAGAPSAPVADAGLQGTQPGAAAGDGVPPVSGPNTDSKEFVEQPSSEPPEMDPGKVVTVQGVNSSKPAGFFWLITKEPTVLLKKKRQDPAGSMRIEVAQDKKVNIAIAENEIFRVVEGRNVEILYQGRKVGTKTIGSGVWLKFVPQSPNEAGGKG